MRIAVYGGSFNPPHVGHGMVAAWLGWTGMADEVWLVPTYHHAFGKDLAPFSDRIALCEALCKAIGGALRVCSIEQNLPAPSYTIDTLRALAARYPEHQFRLIIGADVLPQTAQWRRWSEIQAEFAPLAVGRVGFPEVEGAPMFPGVSSSEVRAAMRAGRSVSHLLPPAVLALAIPLWPMGSK